MINVSVQLTPVSGNRKTGSIPVSMTSQNSCPDCPLKADCYAQFSHLKIHWDKVSQGTAKNTSDWVEFCQKIKALPSWQLWRHNQAGDLPHTEGKIDRSMLMMLVAANQRKRGFTYTHHDVYDRDNRQLLEQANDRGFTINVSCETEEKAHYAMQHGLPAVMVIKADTEKRCFKTSYNDRVIVCPATYDDRRNCANCGICQLADRDYIVAFPAHGTAKKRLSNKLEK